jgi:hypothetical protein
MPDKIYSVTVRTSAGMAIKVFAATLAKARLRCHIERLTGYYPTRPAYSPLMTRQIADMRQRGQIVAPSLRND